MKVLDYVLVSVNFNSARQKKELIDSMNEYLKDGYILQGGAICSGDIDQSTGIVSFYQTLVKYEEELDPSPLTNYLLERK